MKTERRRLTQARIGVLMGGQSSEREVSLRTGAAVHGALCRLGYDAVTVDVGPTLSRDLQEQKIAVAFLALHGPGGEDGSIQGFLETVGIPYTGSGVQASAVGMHKVTTKTVLAAHAIPVPAGLVIKRGERISHAQVLRSTKLRWPVVVKPASEGSTIGVTIVKKPAQWNPALSLAHRYDREAMVEAYIPGHEVTVSLLGRENETPVVLPAVEIVAPGGFYDFSAIPLPGTSSGCRHEGNRGLGVAGIRSLGLCRGCPRGFSDYAPRTPVCAGTQYSTRHDGNQPLANGRGSGRHWLRRIDGADSRIRARQNEE
jgi:D-alanine-D-alanine ligase